MALPHQLPKYAELHCLSNFTFLRGASHAQELVCRAAELGYSALAITDECSLAGVVRAHMAAKEAGLPLIIGTEIQLEDGPKLVLLATDRAGYGNLSELITLGRRRAIKGQYRLRREDLDQGLPGCVALLLPGAAVGVKVAGVEADIAEAGWFAECFADRAWIAVELLCGADDRARLARLKELGRRCRLPLLASGDVHMHLRSRRPLQDVLTAIRLNKPVSQCGHELHPNAERHLRLRMRLGQLYPPELLAATLDVAASCRFSLDSLRYEYPQELVPEGSTPAGHLRMLTEEGLCRRFQQGIPESVRKQIEHELALIAELAYEPYFLTVHDIVAYARRHDILCQGRGSAANSAVCYALGITEVDPARMAMLFERFISKERNEPPDIDVDFEHERREEVIQYIYGKYGRDRAALAATVISYRPKSALRDVGKALGLEISQLDRIAKAVSWWDDKAQLEERLVAAGFDTSAKVIRQLMVLADSIMGFPRHLSQHVGGFVISRGPLAQIVPIENAAMIDRSVIQWDKDDLDALGLLKIDVLALGMLTAIRKALALISVFRQRPLAMSQVPAEDPLVYQMLQKADSVGVFQIESRAQMSMLPRLKPANYYDLVIQVAIVRPGPIQGGMVHPYLRRRAGIEPVTYPSEAVRSVLERTLGVPIFQEQVMQLAMVAAGFSPGEADGLRRSMAAWRKKGGLENFERRLTEGMKERGYQPEFAQAIYQQILGFGEYGFPESHSASFALLVYVSAWIKRFEPAAFLVALLNSQPMGFYGPAQLVQDARRHGVEVRPVDVLESGWECSLERAGSEGGGEPAARLGLLMVKGLSQAGALRIVAERMKGEFASLDDLACRAALNQRDLKCLAAAGALASLSGHRRQAYWNVAGIESRPLLSTANQESLAMINPPTEGESLVADYTSMGLTLGRHPLALLRARLSRMRFASAEAIGKLNNGQAIRACGIVTCRQRPGTASGIVFITLEDETGCVNVVVWRRIGDRQRKELLGASLMGVEGTIEREGEVVHLVARRLIDHSALLGRLEMASRDFH